jgi:hypothetical protein
MFSIPCLAFPHLEHAPSRSFKSSLIPSVARNIGRSLSFPELRIRSGNDTSVLAVVHVEEATMHENDAIVLGKNQIGFPRKVLSMQTEAETHPMDR